MNCRFCSAPLSRVFVDLGAAPPSNALLKSQDDPETYYPLKVYVCDTSCSLVQLPNIEASLFNQDYPYFSSFSSVWLAHAKNFADEAVARFGPKLVVEVASNDGYLLQYFLHRGISVLGFEPALSVARAALKKGVPTVVDFFGAEKARWFRTQRPEGADLLIANNVIAHVPDLNDFVDGLSIALAPTGVLTIEMPHLLNLIQGAQVDTIYHEHFTYFSLRTVGYVLAKHGLRIFDVAQLPTHGGSLRIYADLGVRPVLNRVDELLVHESKALRIFDFQQTAMDVKLGLLEFLVARKRAGKRVAAYGAAAKGASLLNYAGVTQDLIEFVVDNIPAKQGRFMPGSRLPIFPEEKIAEEKPDVILILPWNAKAEIAAKLGGSKAEIVVAVPKIEVVRAAQ